MSAYQLHYLDKIPNHAVVNEAVELAKIRKKGSEKLVNASFVVFYVKAGQILPASNEKTSVIPLPIFVPVWLIAQAQGRIRRGASASYFWKSFGAKQG